jgi:hypothetical protein
MQETNNGVIGPVPVCNGEPVFDPPPIAVIEIKLGADYKPRPELRSDDFELRAQVIQMLSTFKSIGNGTVDSVTVREGLPYAIRVRRAT